MVVDGEEVERQANAQLVGGEVGVLCFTDGPAPRCLLLWDKS